MIENVRKGKRKKKKRRNEKERRGNGRERRVQDLTWDHFRELLCQCPHHGYPTNLLYNFFYEGLIANCKSLVDQTAGGAIRNKTADEMKEIFELLAANSQQKSVRKKGKVAANHLQSSPEIVSYLANISKCMERLATSHNSSRVENQYYEVQGSSEIKDVNFLGGRQGVRNDPYASTYNPRWTNQDADAPIQRRPAEFQSQQYLQPQMQYQQPAQAPNIESLFQQLNAKLDSKFQAMDQIAAHVEKLDQRTNSHDASIRNLERQIGQIAKVVGERGQGRLPSNTETNPKETVMAITLRSGKTLEEAPTKEKEVNSSKRVTFDTNIVVVDDVGKTNNHKTINDNMASSSTSKEASHKPAPTPQIQPYVPKPPFLQRLHNRRKEGEFQKFLEIFKKLEINMPLVDALSQIPSYMRFLKMLISNKHKLKENEVVSLTEECSAILQNKLPPKLKDPGSFAIPCQFCPSHVYKCLCDLGASVNIMPLSLYRKLGLGELKPTSVCLQLADRSIRYPVGIVEDWLVKVGKLIIPIDVLVMEMEYDANIPIILGRPFLITSGALIDVPAGQITLRIGKEREVFQIFKPLSIQAFEDNDLLLSKDHKKEKEDEELSMEAKTKARMQEKSCGVLPHEFQRIT